MLGQVPPLAGAAATALGLAIAALACGPTPSVAPAPTADPFAVVRATSEAAYRSGRDLLERGDVMRGCPLIDTAKTTDPDTRAEIQRDLERCLTAIAQLTPQATPTPARLANVPTVPASGATAVRAPGQATAGAQGQTPGGALNAATPPAQGQATALALNKPSPPTQAPTAGAANADLVSYSDPQGRFAIAAPPDWQRLDQPQMLVGTGIVEFRAASGRASLSVAVDPNARAVSPELYAASLELTMQQQIPGYALEQMQPGSAAGNPSVRRQFTYVVRDSGGRELTERAFQITVLKGQTPYIITASAPANDFGQFSPVFDRMADSFRFS